MTLKSLLAGPAWAVLVCAVATLAGRPELGLSSAVGRGQAPPREHRQQRRAPRQQREGEPDLNR